MDWLVILMLLVTETCSDSPMLHPLLLPPDLGLGDNIDLFCTLKRGTLPVAFEWTKDGRPAKDIPGIVVNVFDRRSVCTIQSIQAEHVGNYTCQADNAEGSDRLHVQLRVEVPPQWTREPADASGAKGSRLVVECAAAGQPAPAVRWRRLEGGGGEPGRRATDGGALEFPRLQEEDAGLYECQATNGVGPGLVRTIRVSVHAAAEVLQRSQSVSVRRGHTARLQCAVAGEAPVEVSWRRAGRELAEARAEVLAEAGRSELLLHDARREDAGGYECLAKNAYGRDRGELQLVVQEPPGPPSQLRASEPSSRSVRLSWQAGEGRQDQFVVRYWRNDEKRGKLHQVTLPGTSVHLQGLHPGTSYSVQIFAQNDVGQGDPSPTLTFRTLEEAPEASPLDVRAEAVSSRSVRVSWKPPQRAHWNGPLLGYSVGQRALRDEAFSFQTVEGGEGRRGGSLLLEGLQRDTAYALVVKAFNGAGAGPPSHEVVVATLHEDPPPAPVLGVSEVSSSSVGVHWKGSPGVVQWLLEWREEGEEWEQLHLAGERAAFSLLGLKASTRYELRLAAYNLFGRGDFSPPLDFTTSLAEVSWSSSLGAAPFYFRPYFVVPVAASVVVIVTTVVVAWVCYKRMTFRQDRLLAACQPLVAGRGVALRPPSYTPPPRHPMPEDDEYDAPWDAPLNPVQGGSYTKLKSQVPHPGGAVVIGHQSGPSR